MITFFKKHRWALYPSITLLSVVVISSLLLIILTQGLPSLSTLESIEPPVVSKIMSRDGVVLDEIHSFEKRIWVPIERMPDHLLKAVIATEDREFYDHWGLNIKRIFYLAFTNIITMDIKGGAGTITGQLARDLYLDRKQSLIRKMREALTALQIERTYAKSEILEMYLNQMYYGNRSYGIQIASQRYFDKPVDDLKIEEAALLVGILQLPAVYNPFKYPDRALRRRNVVLLSMLSFGDLTQAEYDSLKQTPLGVVKNKKQNSDIAPYFCDYIVQEMKGRYGIGIYTDGLTIQTSLDTRIQACADSAVKAHMPEFERKVWDKMIEKRKFLEWIDPPLKSESEIQAFLADTVKVDSLFRAKATVQVSLTAIEPSTGQILAMIGGRDFEQSKYNRAIQSTRQPGSSFKPIVYTVAIDNGYPPSQEVMNTNVVIQQVDGTRWSPQNYDLSVGGLTPLREGLYRSLNLVSVHLVQELISPAHVVSYAKRFGYTTRINPFDAIALGSDGVIPLEHVSAYTVFANGGVRVEPTAILRIEDKDGKVLEESVPRRREVINENTAYIMADMLSGILDNARGTGHRARWGYNFYQPGGGKTGTTNDFTDAWFVGFTKQIAAGVWVGFDDPSMRLGDRMSGATVALPMWAPFMRMVYDTLQWPLVEFVQPEGVTRLKICRESKKIATDSCPEIWDEVFLRDMAPSDTCEVHSAPQLHRPRKRNIF